MDPNMAHKRGPQFVEIPGRGLHCGVTSVPLFKGSFKPSVL